MPNEDEVITQIDAETTENIEEVQDETEEVDVDALKKEIETLKAQKEHWRTKAEKPEKKEEKKADTTAQLSPKDFLALTEQKVSSEDFDEIVRVSSLLGKPIAEALQDNVLKTILKTRQEERATALATQTGGGKRGAKAQTSEVLFEKATRGDLPEKEEDIAKLAEARMQNKLKN